MWIIDSVIADVNYPDIWYQSPFGDITLESLVCEAMPVLREDDIEKVHLTVDYLYNAIEKIGFINELHGDAIECAWQNNDIEFLRTQWEDLALDQIRALQAIINGMLRVTLLNQVTRYRAPIDPKNS